MLVIQFIKEHQGVQSWGIWQQAKRQQLVYNKQCNRSFPNCSQTVAYYSCHLFWDGSFIRGWISQIAMSGKHIT